MLTNIENRLEELFESIETMPPEKVEAAEKVIMNIIHSVDAGANQGRLKIKCANVAQVYWLCLIAQNTFKCICVA